MCSGSYQVEHKRSGGADRFLLHPWIGFRSVWRLSGTCGLFALYTSPSECPPLILLIVDCITVGSSIVHGSLSYHSNHLIFVISLTGNLFSVAHLNFSQLTSSRHRCAFKNNKFPAQSTVINTVLLHSNLNILWSVQQIVFWPRCFWGGILSVK